MTFGGGLTRHRPVPDEPVSGQQPGDRVPDRRSDPAGARERRRCPPPQARPEPRVLPADAAARRGMLHQRPERSPPFGGCSAGEVPSNLALYCAYHQNTSVSPMLFYANDPFVTGNPGLRRRQPSQRPFRRRARGRAEPRAQRVDHRSDSRTTPGPTAPAPTRARRSATSARARWAPRWGPHPTAPSTTR